LIAAVTRSSIAVWRARSMMIVNNDSIREKRFDTQRPRERW
jgi:hypothetical protein